MSAARLAVVSFGDAPPDVALAALGVGDVLLAHDFRSPQALLEAAGAAQREVLWLPAWAHVSTSLVSAIGAWRAHAAAAHEPCLARTRPRLSCGDRAAMTGAARVLLSSPGAVTLDGDRPRPTAAARVEDLGVPLAIHLPDDLTGHLEGVNLQSSVAARLRHAAGRRATWSDLAWKPALLALRALASASGSRREALPHAVIEAYREVLVTAKLWELAHGPALA